MAAFCKQGNEYSDLLRYNVVSIGKLLPTFRRRFLIPSSGFKSDFRSGERKLVCNVGICLMRMAPFPRRLVFVGTAVRTSNCTRH